MRGQNPTLSSGAESPVRPGARDESARAPASPSIHRGAVIASAGSAGTCESRVARRHRFCLSTALSVCKRLGDRAFPGESDCDARLWAILSAVGVASPGRAGDEAGVCPGGVGGEGVGRVVAGGNIGACGLGEAFGGRLRRLPLR
jgi:hypothetical protein